MKIGKLFGALTMMENREARRKNQRNKTRGRKYAR